MNNKIVRMYEIFGRAEGLCKECSHRVRICTCNKTFNKCEIYGISASEATDWKVNQQACGAFNKDVPHRNIYKAYIGVKNVIPDTEQIPGQMEIEL